MSGRYYDYDKGSSRSARDDSRHKSREWEDGERDREYKSRTRSRSPRPSAYSTSQSKYSSERSRSRDKEYREKSYKDDKRYRSQDSDSEEEVPAPPPPPRISKISIDLSKPKGPIKMSLGGPKTEKVTQKPTVASVFADDDDDEPEEMPAEARMRMRNIGRETPTSAGPNSFGKTKQGFCDAKKVFEKNLKNALETQAERPPMPKFPQTIYKIKPTS